MTDLQQARKELAEAQEKIKSVQARIDKLENSTGGFWVPEKGDKYWYISSAGELCYTHFTCIDEDIYRLRHNNIFKTEADAKRKLDIETKLFEIAGEVDYTKTRHGMFYDKQMDALVSAEWYNCNSFGDIVSNDKNFMADTTNQIGESDLKWFYSYGWRRV